MAVSDMSGPDGERDEPWGAAADDSGGDQRHHDQPVELTEEATLLDLEDDDPPLPWLQGDDDEDDFEGSSLGQTISIVLLGLLAIGLVVGGIWWVTSRPDNPVLVADGSTVKAPATPYKQKPNDPGGKVFEGTGDTSFGISEGQKRPARLGEEEAPKPGFASVEKPADKGVPSPAAGGKPAVPAVAAPVAGVGVQVAAYSNQQQAEDGWTRLSGQYSALSGVKHRVVQGQADIGTVFRLQAVAPDANAARDLCGKLKAAGLNCQVKN